MNKSSNFDRSCLFADQQHGFRTNHSCETARHSILDMWKVSVSQKKVNLALFVDQITINIEKSKKELDDYIKRFDSFEFNDNKYETIKKSVTVLNKNYESIISKYKNSLIGNYRYSFQHSNVNLFGSFVSSRKVSKISFIQIFGASILIEPI